MLKQLAIQVWLRNRVVRSAEPVSVELFNAGVWKKLEIGVPAVHKRPTESGVAVAQLVAGQC